MLCFNVYYAHSRSSHPYSLLNWCHCCVYKYQQPSRKEPFNDVVFISNTQFLNRYNYRNQLDNTNDYSITSRVPDNILTSALTTQNNRSGYFLCKWPNHVEQFRINKYIPLLSIHSFARTSLTYAFSWIIHPLIWTIS